MMRFEKEYRDRAVKKLVRKGYSESIALKYYNAWRKDYMKIKYIN